MDDANIANKVGSERRIMTAKVNGIDLYYLESGDRDDETVILIHGLGATLDIWYPTAKFLENSYHVVRFDLRGAGQSDKPKGEYSLEIWNDDLVGLLGHVGVERAHLVGHSLGAMVALRLAIDRSNRVLSLVLAGGVAELSEEARKELQRTMKIVEEEGLEPTVKEENLKAAFAPRTVESHPEILGLHRALSLSEDPDAYLRQCRGLLKNSLKGEFGSIDAPTLLVVGSHDTITPLDSSREIAAEIEGSEIKVVADAGHMVMIERPQKLAELILTFLSKQTKHRK